MRALRDTHTLEQPSNSTDNHLAIDRAASALDFLSQTQIGGASHSSPRLRRHRPRSAHVHPVRRTCATWKCSRPRSTAARPAAQHPRHNTHTNGRPLLRDWLAAPLTDLQELNTRQLSCQPTPRRHRLDSALLLDDELANPRQVARPSQPPNGYRPIRTSRTPLTLPRLR